MQPRTAPRAPEEDLFRQRLENILDTRHELWRLAEQIPWASCSEQFGSLYAERGRPGLPLRLLVGLQLLKHLHAVSDEEVVGRGWASPGAMERTLAWLLNDRRLSRDNERLIANSATRI